MAPRSREKHMAKRKLKAAVYETDWVMAPVRIGQATDGNGYCCLIADTLKCINFTKHISLVNHMREVHQRQAGVAPRGHPKTSSRVRAPLSKEAQQKQKDFNLGNFPSRLWVAKKNHMLRTMKWASNLYQTARPKGDPWQFIQKKQWRTSDDFQRTMNATVATVKKYWHDANIERATKLDARQIQEKSGLPNMDEDYESEDGMPNLDVGRSDLETPQFYFHKRKLKGDKEDGEKSVPGNEEENDEEDDEPIPSPTKKGKSVSSAKKRQETSKGTQVDPSDAIPAPDGRRTTRGATKAQSKEKTVEKQTVGTSKKKVEKENTTGKEKTDKTARKEKIDKTAGKAKTEKTVGKLKTAEKTEKATAARNQKTTEKIVEKTAEKTVQKTVEKTVEKGKSAGRQKTTQKTAEKTTEKTLAKKTAEKRKSAGRQKTTKKIAVKGKTIAKEKNAEEEKGKNPTVPETESKAPADLAAEKFEAEMVAEKMRLAELEAAEKEAEKKYFAAQQIAAEKKRTLSKWLTEGFKVAEMDGEPTPPLVPVNTAKSNPGFDAEAWIAADRQRANEFVANKANISNFLDELMKEAKAKRLATEASRAAGAEKIVAEAEKLVPEASKKAGAEKIGAEAEKLVPEASSKATEAEEHDGKAKKPADAEKLDAEAKKAADSNKRGVKPQATKRMRGTQAKQSGSRKSQRLLNDTSNKQKPTGGEPDKEDEVPAVVPTSAVSMSAYVDDTPDRVKVKSHTTIHPAPDDEDREHPVIPHIIPYPRDWGLLRENFPWWPLLQPGDGRTELEHDQRVWDHLWSIKFAPEEWVSNLKDAGYNSEDCKDELSHQLERIQAVAYWNTHGNRESDDSGDSDDSGEGESQQGGEGLNVEVLAPVQVQEEQTAGEEQLSEPEAETQDEDRAAEGQEEEPALVRIQEEKQVAVEEQHSEPEAEEQDEDRAVEGQEEEPALVRVQEEKHTAVGEAEGQVAEGVEGRDEDSPGDDNTLSTVTPRVRSRREKLPLRPPAKKKKVESALYWEPRSFDQATRQEFDVWSKNVVYFAHDLEWDEVGEVSTVPDSQATATITELGAPEDGVTTVKSPATPFIKWDHGKNPEDVLKGKQQVEGMDFPQWNHLLSTVINQYVKAEKPCAPPVPPPSVTMVVRKKTVTETYEWPATYQVAKEGGTALWLPIEGLRQQLEIKKNGIFKVYLWVYGCRKIRPPRCMGIPHPDVPWHKDLFLWVGPDGYPVGKSWEESLVNWRSNLLTRQKITKKSKALVDIKVLGGNRPEFPHVEIDPEPISVD